MRATWCILSIICVIIAAALFLPSSKVEVTVSNLGIVSTSSLPPVVTLLVTNRGVKTVHVAFDSLEWKSGVGWHSDRLPLGRTHQFPADPGAFILSPGSYRTVTVRGPSHSLDWRVHGEVHLPCGFMEKAKFAGNRLWTRIRGRNSGNLWQRNLLVKVGDIYSPPVSALKEEAQGSPDQEVGAISNVNFGSAQPEGPAHGSQQIRSETNRTSSAAGSGR